MKGFLLASWISLNLLIFAAGIAPSYAADNAEALYKEGKYKEAEEAFRKADMENPKDVSFRYNRGCAAFQAGDAQGSKASFDSVLKRAKDKDILARSAYNLGNAALQTNDFAAAVEAYKKALALNPADGDAKFNLQLALWKKAQAENQKQENKEGENQQEGKDSQSSKDQQGKDQNASKDQKSEQQGDKSQQSGQNKEDKEEAENQENQNPNGKEQNGQKENPQQAETQQQEQAGKQEQAQAQDQKADKGSSGEEQKYEQPQNLEGKLEAAQEQPPGPRKEPETKQSAMIMEQRRANALLDNVKEQPIMQFQKKEKGEKGSPASGKSW